MRDLEYNTLSKPLEQAGGFGSLLYKRREELNQAVRRAGGGGLSSAGQSTTCYDVGHGQRFSRKLGKAA